MVYDPKSKKRGRKASVAAILVQLIRDASSNSKVEVYSETFKRAGGNEYQLGDALRTAVGSALRAFKVDPVSAIVWRDGIGDAEFEIGAQEEIDGIREGLENATMDDSRKSASEPVQLAYVVCQKRVAIKFLSKDVAGHEDGKFGAPSGTLIQDIQGLNHKTFYINGRAPPYSTPKPVRFIIVNRDEGLEDLSLVDLTWDQCHEYPNWPGPVKVPSVCQMAHKLAELAGSFVDGGETINAAHFTNTLHFL
jgi:Piwi domain